LVMCVICSSAINLYFIGKMLTKLLTDVKKFFNPGAFLYYMFEIHSSSEINLEFHMLP
jgi:hypothetical protein